MWQHALNIVLGLGLALIAFVPTAALAVNGVFGWIIVVIGVLIAAISLWGLVDEIHFEAEVRKDTDT